MFAHQHKSYRTCFCLLIKSQHTGQGWNPQVRAVPYPAATLPGLAAALPAASPPALSADQENCFAIWFDLISLLFFFPTLQAWESGRVVQMQLSWQSRREADFALFRGQWAVPWHQATGAFVKASGLIRKTSYAGAWRQCCFRLRLSVSTWSHLSSFA